MFLYRKGLGENPHIFSTEKATLTRSYLSVESGLNRRQINLRNDRVGGYAYIIVPSFELSPQIPSIQAQTWIHNSTPSQKATLPNQNFVGHIEEDSLIW